MIKYFRRLWYRRKFKKHWRKELDKFVQRWACVDSWLYQKIKESQCNPEKDISFPIYYKEE